MTNLTLISYPSLELHSIIPSLPGFEQSRGEVAPPVPLLYTASDRAMEKLIIRGLRLQGRHGWTEAERARAQPFSLDLELEGAFARAEELEETVDYTSVIEKVREINERNFRLIEAFASSVAEGVLADFPRVERVQVRVKKLQPPLPPGTGTAVEWVAAEVVRERSERSDESQD